MKNSGTNSGLMRIFIVCLVTCFIAVPIAFILGSGADGAPGNGISSIKLTGTQGLVDTYTITYTNGDTTTFTVTNGAQGIQGTQGQQGIQGIQGVPGADGHTPVITIGANGNWFVDGVDTLQKAQGVKGETGNGISAIEKTNTEGLVDTYTITFTNGDTTTFTVTNGADGQQGAQGQQGIQGIQGVPGADGHTPVITIGANGNWFVDGVDTLQQAQGLKGETGNGISAITKTGTEGLVDTYTITFTDGTTTTFTVTNGADGQQGQQGAQGQQGIQGIQGVPGADGHTPVITIGENGNWFVDGVDTLQKAQGLKGETGNGISAITKTGTEGLVDTYTITFTDGTTTTFTVTNGADGQQGAQGQQGIQGIQGVPGKDGHTPVITIGTNGNWFVDGVDTLQQAQGLKGETSNGISAIEKTGTEGLVDTYTITFTDGTTTTFTVTNGADGQQGAQGQQGIQGIQGVPGKDGHTPVITIGANGNWFVDGVDTLQQAQGLKGDTGNGISAITKTNTEGLVDTYTITFTDGTTTTFTVTNGKDGLTWFTNSGVPAQLDGQSAGDYCLDVLTSDVYQFDGETWAKVANIKGISVQDIQVEYLYDAQGKLCHRYTFTLTDGSCLVRDVYDPSQVYKIISENYVVPREQDPSAIPEIHFTVIYNNSTMEKITLTKEMIVNIQDVHFSVVGEWKVMVNYYGCIEYIYVTCYDPNVNNATADSYLNYESIVWTPQNVGTLGGLTYTIVYDNPNLPNETLYLTDSQFSITSICNGTKLAAKYETYYSSWDIGKAFPKEKIVKNYKYRITQEGMLEYEYAGEGNWSSVAGIVYGETTINFAIGEHTFALVIQNINNNALQNAEVIKFQYVGDTIYWKDEANPDVIAEKSAVNFDKYGHLIFYIKTPTMEAPYLRNINPTTDIFYRMDTGEDQQLIEFVPTAEDISALQCELHAPIQPGVTNRRYVADNAVPILVSSGTITTESVTLNKTAMFTTDSITDLEVTFHINQYPYSVTVPLTEDMLVDGIGVFATDSAETHEKYEREIKLQYQYYDTTLTGSAWITVVDSTLYPLSSSTSGVKYSTVAPVQQKMKTTNDSATIPELDVQITFRIKEDTDSLMGYDIVSLHTVGVTITKDMITNLDVLDFSKEGKKNIQFVYEGVIRAVDITFYDVYISPIESISNIDPQLEIYYGSDLMPQLVEYFCTEGKEKIWKITYKELFGGKSSEEIVVTPELVMACYDLTNFDSTLLGVHTIPFRYTTEGGGVYESNVMVFVVANIDDAEEYSLQDGTLGQIAASKVSLNVDAQAISWKEDGSSETNTAYYIVEEETDEYIIARALAINYSSNEIFEDITNMTPSQMPGDWEYILDSCNLLIYIDKTTKTISNYGAMDMNNLYTVIDACGIFGNDPVNIFAGFTNGQIVLYTQQQMEDATAENTNPIELYEQLPVTISADGRAATPTIPGQTVTILHGIFGENGQKTLTLLLGAYGEEYAISNAQDVQLSGTNPTLVLTENGLFYRTDEMTGDEFMKMFGNGYMPYSYTTKNGEKAIAVVTGGQEIYATFNDDQSSVTLHLGQELKITNDMIDWSAIVARMQSGSSNSTYYAEGSFVLHDSYGTMNFTLWYDFAYDDGTVSTNTYTSFTDSVFEYIWFDETMLCINLENGSSLFEDIYFQFVKGEDGQADKYIATYTTDSHQAVYNVDFRNYNSIPAEYVVESAQLVLYPNYQADFVLNGDIEGQSTATMSGFNVAMYPQCNAIVLNSGSVSFLFTYETLQIGSTVTMWEVIEGDDWQTYGVDYEEFLNIMNAMSNGSAGVEVKNVKLSLNRTTMMGTLFIHVNQPNQGEIMQSMVFSFLEYGDKIVVLDELFGELKVCFEKSQTEQDVYVMKLDLSEQGLEGMQTIYSSEEFGTVMIFDNGYAMTEKPLDDLTKASLAPYMWLDEDHIFLYSLLGAGCVFKINDDNTLTMANYDIYDIEGYTHDKFVLAGAPCEMFVNQTTGEGVMIYNAVTEGELTLLPVFQDGENVYKSWLFVIPLVYERVGDVFVLRSPQTGTSLD